MVDTQVGSPRERVVLVEHVSEVVGVPVSRISCQVHANVVVEELEAGKQRDFTSGYELCPYQAYLSGQFSLPLHCCFFWALRLCPCERR